LRYDYTMSFKTNRLIVINVIKQISNIKPFKNKWLSDNGLLTLISNNTTSTPIPELNNLDAKAINKLTQINCKYFYFYNPNIPNSLGIFKHSYRPKHSKRAIQCYYFCHDHKSIPPNNILLYTNAMNDFDIFIHNQINTRSNYIPNCFKLSSSSSKNLHNKSSKCARYSNSNNNTKNNNIEIITHTTETSVDLIILYCLH
jgi:hypothetical protein